MAPDIPLAGQRPAEYVHARHVAVKLDEIHGRKAAGGPGRGSGSGSGLGQ